MANCSPFVETADAVGVDQRHGPGYGNTRDRANESIPLVERERTALVASDDARLLPDDVGLLVTPSEPRLSPDASHIVFAVQRVDLEHNRYCSRIWVAAVDGSEPPRAMTAESDGAGVARWSPDGTQIAYGVRPLYDDDAVTELRVVAADGGDHRVVCGCPSEPSELEWSPDGTHLAFVGARPRPRALRSTGGDAQGKGHVAAAHRAPLHPARQRRVG